MEEKPKNLWEDFDSGKYQVIVIHIIINNNMILLNFYRLINHIYFFLNHLF